MRPKYPHLSLSFSTAIALAVACFAFTQTAAARSEVESTTNRPPDQIVIGQYRWSYAAKFVCGYQPPIPTQPGQTLRETVVKPGNYATDINIHNPHYRPVRLDKKLIVMVQNGDPVANEPQSVQPRKVFSMTLERDFATMDDCNNLWKLLDVTAVPAPPAPSLTVGYLVILSPLELDVDVVYTAEVNQKTAAGTPDGDPTGVSIDVERVTGKRVFVPPNTFP